MGDCYDSGFIPAKMTFPALALDSGRMGPEPSGFSGGCVFAGIESGRKMVRGGPIGGGSADWPSGFERADLLESLLLIPVLFRGTSLLGPEVKRIIGFRPGFLSLVLQRRNSKYCESNQEEAFCDPLSDT